MRPGSFPAQRNCLPCLPARTVWEPGTKGRNPPHSVSEPGNPTRNNRLLVNIRPDAFHLLISYFWCHVALPSLWCQRRISPHPPTVHTSSHHAVWLRGLILSMGNKHHERQGTGPRALFVGARGPGPEQSPRGSGGTLRYPIHQSPAEICLPRRKCGQRPMTLGDGTGGLGGDWGRAWAILQNDSLVGRGKIEDTEAEIFLRCNAVGRNRTAELGCSRWAVRVSIERSGGIRCRIRRIVHQPLTVLIRGPSSGLHAFRRVQWY